MKALKWDKKYIEYIIDALGMICLSYVILFFLDMGNEVYQTLRNIQASKAIFMMAVFMFITQRVRLFNGQSLVASLLYWPFGYMYRNRFMESPDLFGRDKIVVLIGWILVLIAVDMIVYKKVNSLQNFRKPALYIFALTAFFMGFYRNGRTEPIIFLVIFLFYLIPIDKERWKHIIYQICGAWILCFGNRLLRSLQENPQVSENGRWYGCFLNIGDFGLFMAAVVTVCLYLIFCAKQSYGRKSIPYIAAWVLMLPVIWTVLRVSTLTMFTGIGCLLIIGFLILPRRSSGRAVLLRTVVVMVGIPIFLLCGLWVLKVMANTDQKYWEGVLLEGNVLLKPIADIIRRAHYMFGNARTFSECGIFEENSLINYLDLLSSGRLSIIKAFSEYFNFTGNSAFGLDVGTYFAYNTHNSYSQMIFEYGYIGGGMFCLWIVSSVIMSVRRYLQGREKERVFLCFWIAMTAGVLIGERVYLYSPVVVFSLLLNYSLMVNMEERT